MIGAIIGDIIGSIYEFDNIKSKEFEFSAEGLAAAAQWLNGQVDEIGEA